MAIEITVPRLGWTMEEGTFLGWLKQEGDYVRAGEPLFTLEGEKATNAPTVVQFDSPQHLETPYGRVRFHDLTYLPGTITLDLFGHEIEMLPRTLFINTKEVPWRNDALFILTPTNKIPGLKDRDYKGRR